MTWRTEKETGCAQLDFKQNSINHERTHTLSSKIQKKIRRTWNKQQNLLLLNRNLMLLYHISVATHIVLP